MNINGAGRAGFRWAGFREAFPSPDADPQVNSQAVSEKRV